MRIAILGVILFFGMVAPAFGQITLTPLFSEGKFKVGQHAQGEFTIRNDNLTPVTVVVEPREAFVVDGKLQSRPIDAADGDVTLNRNSALIGAKQTFVFDYKITPRRLPFVVLFVTRTMIGHVSFGAAVGIVLPEWAYNCPKNTHGSCRESILSSWNMLPKQVTQK